MKINLLIIILIINLFSKITSLNIKMTMSNNNNNYNLPVKRLENGEHNNLILLNNEITSEWCKNWLYDMTLYKKDYPQYMYTDIMSMRIYCETNKDENFFYVAYVPTNVDTIKGPLYIGAFQLIECKRIFNIERIIQNPSNKFLKTSVIDFKNDLQELGKITDSIMNIKPLKNFSDNRYWLDFNLF